MFLTTSVHTASAHTQPRTAATAQSCMCRTDLSETAWSTARAMRLSARICPMRTFTSQAHRISTAPIWWRCPTHLRHSAKPARMLPHMMQTARRPRDNMKQRLPSQARATAILSFGISPRRNGQNCSRSRSLVSGLLRRSILSFPTAAM